MRQHKYRAWDKIQKRMHPNPFNGVIGGMNDIFANTGDWIFMDYIEEEDVNNTEIYECDFLKDDYGRLLLVEWWQHGFTFRAITETNFFRAHNINQWFEKGEELPEIIGNLYENPELMGGKDRGVATDKGYLTFQK